MLEKLTMLKFYRGVQNFKLTIIDDYSEYVHNTFGLEFSVDDDIVTIFDYDTETLQENYITGFILDNMTKIVFTKNQFEIYLNTGKIIINII
ncbi:hypothetical protein SAMN02745217_04241 [Anaerocolumna xylanovorans DSM 12503]|uniref:Uncharacterized protein n=1 Tax=Anaerocolumna xylanovorans DSM 12503 TaxID=1121345 RepID=A0A1M7YM39_9FIRM|nr:hypothetical protein SAMN02745217_04241 [Anaerocolumna xylanovorans DSM 12503]